MSYDSIFVSAAEEWARQPNNARTLIAQLDSVFRQETADELVPAIEYRTDNITDFRGYNGPASMERLIRWDYRDPDVIFRDGFRALERAQDAPNEHLSLVRHTDSNENSIFVSTARYYRLDQRSQRWTPRNLFNRFEYEIFAHGGIDVNLSLGSRDQHWRHRYWNQREIAFPGGIRTECIRIAREYNSNGRLSMVFYNERFNLEVLQEHRCPIARLPPCTVRVEFPYVSWPVFDYGDDEVQNEGGPGHDELRKKRDAGPEPMKDDGEVLVDEYLVGSDRDLETFSMRRACLTCERSGKYISDAWFFALDRYIKIRVEAGTNDDKVLVSRRPIIQGWSSLEKAGFLTVDAAFRMTNNRVAFFRGRKYVVVEVEPGSYHDKLLSPPKFIKNDWPALRQIGFTRLDAATEVGDQAYVFMDDKCAIIDREPSGRLHDHFNFAQKWGGLHRAGFISIDAALWGNHRGVYLFSGPRYLLMDVDTGEVINGPKRVDTEWPSLRESEFYLKHN